MKKTNKKTKLHNLYIYIYITAANEIQKNKKNEMNK